MEEEDDPRKEILDKRTPPCVPGVTMNFRDKDKGNSAAQKVLAYQEKEFNVEPLVLRQIEQMNVIPKQYLLVELACGSQLEKTLSPKSLKDEP